MIPQSMGHPVVLNYGGEWVAPSSPATSLHLYVVLVTSILKYWKKQRQAHEKVWSGMKIDKYYVLLTYGILHPRRSNRIPNRQTKD